MKKVISILCILLLLIATSNLAVNIHFCGDHISSIDFFGKTNGCSGTCDSKHSIKEKSCCKNFTAVITTDDSTTTTFSFQSVQPLVCIIPTKIYSIVPTTITQSILKGSVACNAPPNLSAQPYYILYRSLII